MPKSTRGKGEGALFKDARGYWTATVELPQRDGKRRRKTVRARDKEAAKRMLLALHKDLMDNGDLPTTDQTVAQWFDYWFKKIAQPEVRPKTAEGYRTITYNHIIPTIGNIRLSKVSARSLRTVTDRITSPVHSAGEGKPLRALSPTYALQVHRVMSIALEAAVREKRITSNPAKSMNAPRKALMTIDALTLQEGVDAIRTFRQDGEYGARWATALLTGARRGEVLGLEIDRVGESLDLSWQLQRMLFEHGCATRDDGKHSCRWTRGAECPERKITAPADYEYRSIGGGLYLTRPKSRSGWRVIPLVDPLRTILAQHIEANPPINGLVFTRGGKPVDPDYDTKLWKKWMEANMPGRDVKLHGLRHTTADLLYLAGVPEDLITEILGHSTRAMSRAYKSKGNDLRLRQAMASMSAMFDIPVSEARTAIES
jgi:integrase